MGLCLPMFLFTQCGHRGVLAKTSMSPAEEVTEVKNKYTTAQIAEGKMIYDKSCGKCHELHEPEEFKVARWDRILAKMCPKAKLNSEQAALVRAWVITNAKAE